MWYMYDMYSSLHRAHSKDHNTIFSQQRITFRRLYSPGADTEMRYQFSCDVTNCTNYENAIKKIKADFLYYLKQSQKLSHWISTLNCQIIVGTPSDVMYLDNCRMQFDNSSTLKWHATAAASAVAAWRLHNGAVTSTRIAMHGARCKD